MYRNEAPPSPPPRVWRTTEKIKCIGCKEGVTRRITYAAEETQGGRKICLKLRFLYHNKLDVKLWAGTKWRDNYPLFSEDEVMNDDDVGNEGYDSDEGAKYNNYDSQSLKLPRTDTLKWLFFCKSDTDFTHTDAVESSMVS